MKDKNLLLLQQMIYGFEAFPNPFAVVIFTIFHFRYGDNITQKKNLNRIQHTFPGGETKSELEIIISDEYGLLQLWWRSQAILSGHQSRLLGYES